MIVKLICQTCGKAYGFEADEVPDNAIQGTCNWCPCCEDQADDYYIETWYKSNGDQI